MTERYVYLNGRIVAAARARVPVQDRGLLYGDALFETMRTEDGTAVRLGEHVARMCAGARLLGFPEAFIDTLPDKISGAAIEKLLRRNGLDKGAARVRVTVTRGEAGCGHAIPSDERTHPTVIITAEPVDDSGISRVREKGIKAVLLSGLAPLLSGVKSTNFLPNVLGKAEARKRGAFEGIFVDAKGSVTEATAANVFCVTSGALKTPALSGGLTGALPGVTRGVVIGLARGMKLKVKEARVTEKEILKADELFLTSSVMGVVPVVEIDGKKIAAGKPGPITRSIQAAYEKDG